ncbi:hypothetical protein [Burkholderia sp. IDO3]|uniref:hypothetical protein n=1 Tax=Burkholderia sp. IDO3 TaxID=1705310 RepID=UPI000BBA8412|nr:hypothetical protein [Burkholderia sp. IDO3]AXK64749.1 hypothetical protein DCN14_18915 [Burkholderia sp. IDO3]PCD61309.1 hypothetical protein CN645_13350 [Burkholderia sp. IDO3]
MQSLRFNKISICSENEQKAYSETFHPRKTLLLGGNSTGKSTIIKSLFRAFDAEPTGDLRNWDYSAIVAVDFSVNDIAFTTIRRGDLKALFRGQQLLGVTTSSARWNEIFSEAVGFHLQLMDREENLRAATPSMFFLPFYINQDGSFFGNWDTFKSLKQFDSSAIPHTLEYFAQVRPFQYFELKGRERTAKSKLTELDVEASTLQRTRLRLRRSLKASHVKLSTAGFEREVHELAKLATELGTKQDKVRSELVEGQELSRQITDQIRLAEAALREHEADFKSVSSATAEQGTFRCPTCHAEHDASFHTFLELAEDARELYRLKERLRQNLDSVSARMSRSRREAASLRTQYVEVSNILAVKRGRRTFEDVVKSHGAEAAESALDAEIASIQKAATATAETIRGLKIELDHLMKNHDTGEPLRIFRETFKELLVVADVPEFSNVGTWKLNKRPTDSGSPGPRSVVAYYGALWTVMKSAESFLPSPIVIDSPNQNAQDRKHLERVMGLLASKTPANAQVILCAEDPSDSFNPDKVIQLERERALLESDQMDEVSARVLPLIERATTELGRAG